MSDTNELRAVKLTKARRDVLHHLSSRGLSVRRLADKIGRNSSSTSALLDRMKSAGLIREIGEVWFATDAGLALSTSDARAPSVEEGKHGG